MHSTAPSVFFTAAALIGWVLSRTLPRPSPPPRGEQLQGSGRLDAGNTRGCKGARPVVGSLRRSDSERIAAAARRFQPGFAGRGGEIPGSQRSGDPCPLGRVPNTGSQCIRNTSQGFDNAPLARALNGISGTRNDFVAGIDLSWEVDLFGRLRNAAVAAGAQAQASAADLAAVELSLQAELATDYFSLRGDDTTIQLLEDTIKVYDRAYDLTHNRYKEGISAATDVDQADTLRQNARSQLAAYAWNVPGWNMQLPFCWARCLRGFNSSPGRSRARLHRSMRACPPRFWSVVLMWAARSAPWPLQMRRSEWRGPPGSRFSPFQDRPDSRASVVQLVQCPQPLLVCRSGATLPLLDAGARYGLNKQARAQYDEAAATYRKTTLTAYQEVEDNLAGLHHLADQRQADEAAASSAQSSAYHADQRYDAGVADYVEVTTTHTAALNAQRDTISVRVAQMNASVALVRATGGGWTQEQIDHPAMP